MLNRSPGRGVFAEFITREESNMVRVVGIDHIVIRVSDFQKSKAFYDKLLTFLGFKVLGDYGDQIGWTNGKTRYWIGQADFEGLTHKYRIGDVGLHHYAFELRSRKDVDDLQEFLKREGVTIFDLADEHYDDYYAVFFLDPDGIKLEGMKWGEEHAKAKAARARKRSSSAKRGSAEKGAATAKKKASAAAKKKSASRKSVGKPKMPRKTARARAK
jgi:catechol 2,3-dioxygenase-like lactoylglutathione lyase family enzyme